MDVRRMQGLLVAIALSGLAAAQGPGGASTQAGAVQGSPAEGSSGLVGRPYPALTDTPRTFTNFNVEVVRGFVSRPLPAEPARGGPDAVDAPLETFALNAYESTVVRFVGGRERGRWRTVHDPVSIALHGDSVLVVGQGSHALARHDAATGELLDLLMLPSEPADIAVDADHGEAWVSCMGADAVVQVELGDTLRALRVWSWDEGLRLKRPRFLFLDPGGPDPDDNVLYVAPLVSGNNTLALASGGASIGGVVDGTTLPGGGLPDEDLFRIARGAQRAEPVVRGAGSLILAHGRNPFDGRYHLLTVGHRNFDPDALSEPLVRGTFADHGLAVLEPSTLATTGGAVPSPDDRIDLDDHDPATPGPQYTPARSLSFPYALAFEPGTGRLAVAASTTPLVALLDPDGRRVAELDLDRPGRWLGLVPRTLAFDGRGRLHVYCQETANILVFDLERPARARLVAELDLGNDPTPEPVRRGRRTWYDARPSLDGRSSCNSCHVQGGADGLAWFLADDPVDAKDVMVTQTLFGIEDSFPYHWRGERDLEAFNGAFPGLLGHGEALDPAALDDFVEFVFSLTAPANPLQVGPPRIDGEGRIVQDLDRQVKDQLVPFGLGAGLTPVGPYGPLELGSATRGLTVYTDSIAFNQRACVDCHPFPTGASGDGFADNTVLDVSSAATLKAVQLDNQLALKHQPVVRLQDPNGKTIARNLLGFGLAHAGDKVNLLDFNLRFFGNISATDVLDVTAFVHLFDNGLAPAAHFAAVLDADSPADTLERIDRWLVQQAHLGWVDAVAFGRERVGDRFVTVGWLYDPATGVFVPDRPGLAPRELAAFADFAATPQRRTTFLGTPPGNGRRLGLDLDADGLINGLEPHLGTDPFEPDTDGDGWPDGHEHAGGTDPLAWSRRSLDRTPPGLVPGSLRVDFVNAVSAKLHFETDEPCTWAIDLGGPGLGAVHEDRLTFDTVHTAVVQRLSPSTTGQGLAVEVRNTYTGQLVLTDLAGNASAPIPLPPLTTGSMIHDGSLESLVVGALTLEQEQRTASSYSALVTARVDFKEQGPPAIPAAGHVVVLQVLERAANGFDWEIVPLARLQHDAPATDFKYGSKLYGQTPGLRPGPFLIPVPADGNGEVAVRFTVNGLAPGQEVMANVITALLPPGNWNPSAPAMNSKFGLGAFQLPATASEKRRVVSTR